MTKLRIAEVFYSLQGEGARAGDPSVFVRLSGCNLTCGFCDTEFESGKEMTCEELLDQIAAAQGRAGGVTEHPCRWLVWTGGEPTLQLTDEHVAWFKERGYQQAIETNGTNRAPAGLDWIVVSPKVADHVWAKNFPDGVHELRVVRHAGQPAPPNVPVPCQTRFLSPLFDGNRPNKENLKHCIRLCLENPEWSLSLQLHKILGVL